MYWSYIFVGLSTLSEQQPDLALADIVVGYSSSCRWNLDGIEPVASS